MSNTIITETNNPTLWNILNDLWESWKNPGWVEYGNALYHVEALANGTVQFRFMEVMDYLDTRSLSGSRKASYKKLDGS